MTYKPTELDVDVGMVELQRRLADLQLEQANARQARIEEERARVAAEMRLEEKKRKLTAMESETPREPAQPQLPPVGAFLRTPVIETYSAGELHSVEVKIWVPDDEVTYDGLGKAETLKVDPYAGIDSGLRPELDADDYSASV